MILCPTLMTVQGVYHLKCHHLPIKVTIKYENQYQILPSLNKKNKSDIYQEHF